MYACYDKHRRAGCIPRTPLRLLHYLRAYELIFSYFWAREAARSAAQPLYTRFTKIICTSVSEARQIAIEPYAQAGALGPEHAETLRTRMGLVNVLAEAGRLASRAARMMSRA